MSDIDEGVGSVFYPGIQQIVSASYTRSHGITPDVCTIEMAPQSLDASEPGYTPIEPDGWLLFQFDTAKLGNDGNTIRNRTQIFMQGCRPGKASVRRSDKSIVWTIPVYDRRWKWKYGSFSGHWNIKKNGVIESRKQRTPKQLADMCLEAMGEKNYDSSALEDLEKLQSLAYRNQIFPEVHWDRIPPAQALNELVVKLGYRVCLKWDDTVAICKYGEGALLPTDDLMSGGFEANLPETPSSVTVVGGITMHEAIWELEPVGLDIDGEWRPLDHLSYIPVSSINGADWRFSEPGVFDGILAEYEEIEDDKTDGIPVDEDEYKKRKEQYSLAVQTVYRCYRLKYPVGTEETKSLRSKYDLAGIAVAQAVNDGQRRGDKKFDKLLAKYEEARRELFLKAKPVLPGPKKINPRSGRLGDYELEEFEQVLPCFKTRAELAVDSYTGKLTRRPPEVTGIWYDPRKVSNTQVVDEKLRTADVEQFDVVPELGIIRFKEPMYRYEKEKIESFATGKKSDPMYLTYPAKLFVKIATPLKNTVGEPARYEHREELKREYRTTPAELPSGVNVGRKLAGGTDTKVVTKNEIVLAYQARYETKKGDTSNPSYYKLKEVVTNEESEGLENQALAAIDVENIRLASKNPGSGIYAGLKKIDLDGAIQQISISRNTSGGMTTTISRNSEVNVIVPTFDQRQRENVLRDLIKEQDATVDKTEQVKPEGS